MKFVKSALQRGRTNESTYSMLTSFSDLFLQVKPSPGWLNPAEPENADPYLWPHVALEHCLCQTQDDTDSVAPEKIRKTVENAKLRPYPRRHRRSCAESVVLGDDFRHFNSPKMTVVLCKISSPETTPKTTCLLLAIQSRWSHNRVEFMWRRSLKNACREKWWKWLKICQVHIIQCWIPVIRL